MQKIVINRCFGGFGLSKKLLERAEALGKTLDTHSVARDDPTLVALVEEMGDESGDTYAALAVVEIPDGVAWDIDDYDGMESIHECHESWS